MRKYWHIANRSSIRLETGKLNWFSVGLTLGGGDSNAEIQFHIGLFYWVWFTLDYFPMRKVFKPFLKQRNGWENGGKELEFEIHSDHIGWKLFSFEINDNSWRSKNFYFWNFLLGRKNCTQELLEERDVLIPMPEKSYKATAKLVLYTWKRPRWFAESFKRVEIKVPSGIPHQGKGENSWDCGEDATFGMTTGRCNSITEGVGKLVGSVLTTRVKYGGWKDYKWKVLPPPKGSN